MRRKALIATLALVYLACSSDDSASPENRKLSGNWGVDCDASGCGYTYSLVEDADGRVTGTGTYSPSNSVTVTGTHFYPTVTLALLHREGAITFNQNFTGTFDGKDRIIGRRASTDEVWTRR